MRQNVSHGFSDRLVSRRAVVSRFAGASVAAMVAASGSVSFPIAVQGAPAHITSSVVDGKKGFVMSDVTPTSSNASPTVVLVHGAFADSSGWAGVIERLQGAGIAVTAAVNPLRSVSHDSAYVASFVQQIPGPVLLVGHSYGGVVISNAASAAGNVVGLVYVSAFAPDEGESLMDIEADSKDSVLNSSLLPLQYPTGQGSETAVELIINPEHYHQAFAADLPEEQTKVMALYQRPAAALAFSEVSGAPAWKSLPSWAVVATGDKAAGTDVLRTMATRAEATITEVDGSHAIMISQPQAVTDVIMAAFDMVS